MTLKFATFAAMAVLLIGTAGAESNDPQSAYTAGYLEFNRGQKFQESGNLRDALGEYLKARSTFDYVRNTWPTWQTQMVEYRRKKVYELVANLGGELDGPGPTIPPDRPPVDGGGSGSSDGVGSTNWYKVLEEERRRSQQILAEKDRKLSEAMRDKGSAENEMKRLQSQIAQLRIQGEAGGDAGRRLEQAEREALVAKAREREALAKVSELEGNLNSAVAGERARLETELAAAKQTAVDAQSGRADLEGKIAALGQELAIAKEAANQVQGQLEAAVKAAQHMQTALAEANERAERESLEKIELQRQLEEFEKTKKTWEMIVGSGEGGAVNGAVIEEVMAELDRKEQELADAKKTINEQRDQIARLERQNAVLKGENAELVAELARTGEQLKMKSLEVEELKKELETVNGEVQRLRKENDQYKIDVAEFQKELKETTADLTAAMKNQAGVPVELAEENELMRSHIIRMMRGQSLRMQKKELIIKELVKRGNNYEEVIEMLEDFSSEVPVEIGALSYLGDPVEVAPGRMNAILAQPGNGSAELPVFNPNDRSMEGNPIKATPPPANSGPVGDLQSLLVSAGDACALGDYERSETEYQDYLRADPDNATALSNLGLVKMNLGKYREADNYLRKALDRKPGDGFSLFILGVNSYHESQLGVAKEALEGTLTVDPTNAEACHYLGVIAIEEGDRAEAIKQFRRALEIKADYGTAHYNLSVLYATETPIMLDEAHAHYEKALENGAERDEAMDELLY